MPPNTVKVDRGTLFGNPFPLMYFGGDRFACVARFRELAEAPPLRPLIVERLRGKNLACWCRLDQICHADVLLEIANSDSRSKPLVETACGLDAKHESDGAEGNRPTLPSQTPAEESNND